VFPKPVTSKDVQLLFRPTGVDAKLIDDLQAQVTNTFINELERLTHEQQIESDPFYSGRMHDDFRNLLRSGCSFQVPGPGLVEKASKFLRRPLSRLLQKDDSTEDVPPPVHVTFFSALCEYFLEDYKTNARLDRILNLQL